MEDLLLHIEAVLFAAEQPVTVAELVACVEKGLGQIVSPTKVVNCIAELTEQYRAADYSFELVGIGGGYRFLTKADFHKTIAAYANQRSRKRLSTAALETLAIIAYKQPITKAEIEQIRGVNCDYSIQKLLEKELIEIAGRQIHLAGPPVALSHRSLLYGSLRPELHWRFTQTQRHPADGQRNRE